LFTRYDLIHVVGIRYRFDSEVPVEFFQDAGFVKMLQIFDKAMGRQNSQIFGFGVGQPH